MALYQAFDSLVTSMTFVIIVAMVLIFCFASQILDALTGGSSGNDLSDSGSMFDD